MGLKPVEVYRLTLVEFAMMEMGYFTRRCIELDGLRDLKATIMTFAGMGSSKLINPKDVMGIPFLDNEDAILPVKTRQQALKMIDLYINGEEWQN